MEIHVLKNELKRIIWVEKTEQNVFFSLQNIKCTAEVLFPNIFV